MVELNENENNLAKSSQNEVLMKITRIKNVTDIDENSAVEKSTAENIGGRVLNSKFYFWRKKEDIPGNFGLGIEI